MIYIYAALAAIAVLAVITIIANARAWVLPPTGYDTLTWEPRGDGTVALYFHEPEVYGQLLLELKQDGGGWRIHIYRLQEQPYSYILQVAFASRRQAAQQALQMVGNPYNLPWMQQDGMVTNG